MAQPRPQHHPPAPHGTSSSSSTPTSSRPALLILEPPNTDMASMNVPPRAHRKTSLSSPTICVGKPETGNGTKRRLTFPAVVGLKVEEEEYGGGGGGGEQRRRAYGRGGVQTCRVRYTGASFGKAGEECEDGRDEREDDGAEHDLRLNARTLADSERDAMLDTRAPLQRPPAVTVQGACPEAGGGGGRPCPSAKPVPPAIKTLTAAVPARRRAVSTMTPRISATSRRAAVRKSPTTMTVHADRAYNSAGPLPRHKAPRAERPSTIPLISSPYADHTPPTPLTPLDLSQLPLVIPVFNPQCAHYHFEYTLQDLVHRAQVHGARCAMDVSHNHRNDATSPFVPCNVLVSSSETQPTVGSGSSSTSTSVAAPKPPKISSREAAPPTTNTETTAPPSTDPTHGFSTLALSSRLSLTKSNISLWKTQPTDYGLEHIDVFSLYYREYFYEKDHTNYLGLVEPFGQVIVSVKREKQGPQQQVLLGTGGTGSVAEERESRGLGSSSAGQVQGRGLPASVERGPSTHTTSEGSTTATATTTPPADLPKDSRMRVIIRSRAFSDWRLSFLESTLKRHHKLPDRQRLSRRTVLPYLHPSLDPERLIKVSSKRIERQLLKLDEVGLSCRYKFGVMYAKAGQTTEEQILGNEHGSVEFERFLTILGNKVELKGFTGFTAGLDTKNGNTGQHTLHTTWREFKITYHVSTFLPYLPNDPQQIQRKRHIGNDIVCLVFMEGAGGQFDPRAFKSQFLHVFIVVTKEDLSELGVADGREAYRVSVACNESLAGFGPALPTPPVFTDRQQLREFLMTKMINAENAAYKAPRFSKLETRTRKGMVDDMVTYYVDRYPPSGINTTSTPGLPVNNSNIPGAGSLPQSNRTSSTAATATAAANSTGVSPNVGGGSAFSSQPVLAGNVQKSPSSHSRGSFFGRSGIGKSGGHLKHSGSTNLTEGGGGGRFWRRYESSASVAAAGAGSGGEGVRGL